MTSPDNVPRGDSGQTPAIEALRLTKVYSDRPVVDGIDLSVPQGTSFGFVGPNGAGKTTTLSMLTGLLLPTSGSVRILGLDLTPDNVDVKRLVGVVPDRFTMFSRLKAEELLRYHGLIYGLPRQTLAPRIEELIERLELSAARRTPVGEYSHGMQKRLAFAAAILHGPRVLFLDEPFEGLDPLSVRLVAANLEAMVARGTTMFLTSHMLELVERLCTRVAIIGTGRLLWEGACANLPDLVAHNARDKRVPALEQVFVDLVGTERATEVFSWLKP